MLCGFSPEYLPAVSLRGTLSLMDFLHHTGNVEDQARLLRAGSSHLSPCPGLLLPVSGL